jgi:hypothetical protein
MLTLSKTKTLKEILNVFVLKVLIKSDLKNLFEHQKKILVYLIQAQEMLNPILFGP